MQYEKNCFRFPLTFYFYSLTQNRFTFMLQTRFFSFMKENKNVFFFSNKI